MAYDHRYDLGGLPAPSDTPSPPASPTASSDPFADLRGSSPALSPTGNVSDPFADLRSVSSSDTNTNPLAEPASVGPQQGGLSSAFSGAVHGLTAGWVDPVASAIKSGAAQLAYEHWSGKPGPATDAYNKAMAEADQQTQAMQKQHPILYGGGELAGAGASMLAAGPEEAAVGFLPRMAQAAKVGAGYGAASGASENINQGIPQAAVGALSGGVEGAVGGAGGEALGAGLGKLGSLAYDYAGRPIVQAVRGLVSPEAEPARRVAAAYAAGYPGVAAGRDIGLTPAQFSAAQAAGEPVMLGDIGGEPTRALMRSAANASPEGRAALNDVIQQRFAEQSDRAGMTIRSLVSGGADTAKTKAQLEADYDAERVGAYSKAYDAGDRPIWSPELERLTAAPSIQSAIRGAVNTWRDWQVRDGFGAMNPPIKVTPDGQLKFLPGGMMPYPNIQLWDYAQRQISDAARNAEGPFGRATQESARLNGLAGQLKTELDKQVPEFGQARGVAATYFGGNNAIDAGQKALNFKGNIRDLQRQMAMMQPAERGMFQESYADALARQIENAPDRQDITRRLMQSPQARARTAAVFGPQGAQTMQSFVDRENIYDAARKALGNSSTVRQMLEAGLAGGGGTYLFTGDPSKSFEAGLAGAGVGFGGARAGMTHGLVSFAGKSALGYVDRQTATRVAQLLSSNDPTQLKRGLQIASRNARIGNALHDMASRGAALFGTVERPRFLPQLPGPAAAQTNQQNIPGGVQQQQAGGRVNGFKDFHTASEYAKGGAVNGLATKSQANYRGGSARWSCAWCQMFVKPSSCSAVRGHISPRALCDYYEPDKGHERIVDNKHDVVTGANSSKKPEGPIFIDRHIPEWSPKLRTRDGKRVRLWTYLSIHEDNEQKHMAAGDGYSVAHDKATAAERKKAEADGVNWSAYTKEIDKYLRFDEHEKAANPPDQPLHVKPKEALDHHHSKHKGG